MTKYSRIDQSKIKPLNENNEIVRSIRDILLSGITPNPRDIVGWKNYSSKLLRLAFRLEENNRKIPVDTHLPIINPIKEFALRIEKNPKELDELEWISKIKSTFLSTTGANLNIKLNKSKNSQKDIDKMSEMLGTAYKFLERLIEYNNHPTDLNKIQLEESISILHKTSEINIPTLNSTFRDEETSEENDLLLPISSADCDEFFKRLSESDRHDKAIIAEKIKIELQTILTKKLGEFPNPFEDPIIIQLLQVLAIKFEEVKNNFNGIIEVDLKLKNILNPKPLLTEEGYKDIEDNISKELKQYCYENPSFLTELIILATGFNESQISELFLGVEEIKEAKKELENAEELEKAIKQEYDKTYENLNKTQQFIFLDKNYDRITEEDKRNLENMEITLDSIEEIRKEAEGSKHNLQRELKKTLLKNLTIVFNNLPAEGRKQILELLKNTSQAVEVSMLFPEIIYSKSGHYESKLRSIQLLNPKQLKVIEFFEDVTFNVKKPPPPSFITETDFKIGLDSLMVIERKIISNQTFPSFSKPPKPQKAPKKITPSFLRKKVEDNRFFKPEELPSLHTLENPPATSDIFSCIPKISETKKRPLDSFKELVKKEEELVVKSIEINNIKRIKNFTDIILQKLNQFFISQETPNPIDKFEWKNFDNKAIKTLKELIIHPLSPFAFPCIERYNLQLLIDEISYPEDFEFAIQSPAFILFKAMQNELLKTIIPLTEKEGKNIWEINKNFLEEDQNFCEFRAKAILEIFKIETFVIGFFNNDVRTLKQFELDFEGMLVENIVFRNFLKVISNFGLNEFDVSIHHTARMLQNQEPESLLELSQQLPYFNFVNENFIQKNNLPQEHYKNNDDKQLVGFPQFLIRLCQNDERKIKSITELIKFFNMAYFVSQGNELLEFALKDNPPIKQRLPKLTDNSILSINLLGKEHQARWVILTIINNNYETGRSPVIIVGTSTIFDLWNGQAIFHTMETSLLSYEIRLSLLSQKFPINFILIPHLTNKEKLFKQEEARVLQRLEKATNDISSQLEELCLKLNEYKVNLIFDIKVLKKLEDHFSITIKRKNNLSIIALELTENFPEELLEKFSVLLASLSKIELQILKGEIKFGAKSDISFCGEDITKRIAIEQQIKLLEEDPKPYLFTQFPKNLWAIPEEQKKLFHYFFNRNKTEIIEIFKGQKELFSISPFMNDRFEEISELAKSLEGKHTEEGITTPKKIFPTLDFRTIHQIFFNEPTRTNPRQAEIEETNKTKKEILRNLLKLRKTIIMLDKDNNTIFLDEDGINIPTIDYKKVLVGLGLNEENAERMAKIFGDFEEKALQSIYPEIQFEDLFSRKRESDKLEEEKKEEENNNNNNKRIRNNRNQDIETKSESGSEGKEEVKGEEETARARENERMEMDANQNPTSSPNLQNAEAQRLTSPKKLEGRIIS